MIAKINVDLFQFIIDLARVAPSQQNEQIEGIIIELQFLFLRAVTNNLSRFLFPAGPRGVEPINHLQFRAPGQGFIKRAAFVHVDRADQEHDTGAEVGVN